MAPLLGRKPFPLVKPLPGEEPLFTIAHTQEAFRTREEYEARLERYSERIWTCKSTGSSQLTHKEAWEEEQEVAELLKEEFPAWYEKLVLEMVHHNTASLEKLVDTAWLEIMTKYAVGEECDFEVGKEKMLKVRIVKIHPLEKVDEEATEKKSDGACDSPSSDKENSSQIAQDHQKKEAIVKEDEGRRESINDRARRSPRKLPTSLKKGERKWAPPKFLPHKYDVKLQNEDKIISNVPADSLIRTERPPNKEILRYFIRHNALRAGTGENAPWVVEDELVKKYSLPSKFSDFLLDPYKYMTLNPSTKRKNTGSPDRKPSKKSKTDNSSLNSPLNPKLWCHVHLKKSLNGSPLKVKNSKNSRSPEEHLEEVMKMMSPNKLHANFHIPKKGPPAKKSGKHSDKPLKAKGRSKGILNGQKSTGNSKSPKKGLKTPKTKMKQMTLLDMAKGTQKMTRAPRNSGGTARSSSKPHKHLPPAALHLIAYYKENKDREDKKSALSCVISKTARLLSSEDRARLPEELRSIVQKRFELLEHKKRWASMSEEQRKEYLKKKREELKEKLKEKAKERREKEMLEKLEKQKRYEDQELTGKSLPAFRLVDTPEGLPNTLFGDVAMVVEFLSCYSGLLLPDAQYPITAVSLMEALSAEKGGFLYLNRVLVILLQTLLQDEIAEDYGELGMKLSEIPLTLHSVSELVRLCLRRSDVQEESEGSDTDDNKDSAPFEDNEVQDEFLEKLETSEFFELTSEEKLQILTALCHRILMTYSVQDHMETRQQMSAELWKERLAVLKEENDKKRAEKQKRKEMEARNKENGKEENGLGKPDRKKEVVKFEPQVDLGAEDMISAVKSRRLLAIQAKKEREIQEREMKVKLEREAEEERIRKHKAAAEKAFQEGIAKAKLVMRRTPIGTDRNHNRVSGSLLQLADHCCAPSSALQVYLLAGEDDKLILCDECNKAFHLFCLRPALYEVPDGEWQCPACQPATARRNSRGRNYTEESASEDSEDDESEEEEEEEEEEVEEEDYEVAGLRLRPRKTVRGKQGVIPPAARPGRRPGKKPHPARKSRPKAPPVDDMEVEELVLQTKRSSRRQSLELQKCEDILHKIVKYRFSWPFREPVTRDEAEDYYDIITQPMDFQTMQNKCSCGSYRSVQEFLTDMKQVFTNAELYNCRGSHVLNCMVKTEQCLVALLHKHLPSHPYVRRKRKKFPDRLAEDEGDSESEPVGQSRGRRQKK
uniref:Tyrosine-protein kinase BAZ1B n=1 Tax=Canis lupus familiaris TaxID=9615 RepID=A0A8C0SCN7_CANLF